MGGGPSKAEREAEAIDSMRRDPSLTAVQLKDLRVRVAQDHANGGDTKWASGKTRSFKAAAVTIRSAAAVTNSFSNPLQKGSTVPSWRNETTTSASRDAVVDFLTEEPSTQRTESGGVTSTTVCEDDIEVASLGDDDEDSLPQQGGPATRSSSFAPVSSTVSTNAPQRFHSTGGLNYPTKF